MSRGKISLSFIGILFMCFFCLTAHGEEAAGEKFLIQIVHNNPCEACNEPKRLTELVYSLKPEEGIGAGYDLRIYYAYRSSDKEILEELLERFGLEENEIFYPFLAIGDHYLSGEAAIEEHLTEYMREEAARTAGEAETAEAESAVREAETTGPERTVKEAEIAGPESAESENDSERTAVKPSGPALEDKIPHLGADTIHIVYFHTANCPNCEEAESFLETLPDTIEVDGQEYPLVITRLSLADPENSDIFYQLSEAAEVKDQDRKVPLLFLGIQYLSGKDSIKKETEELLKMGAGLGADYSAGVIQTRAKEAPAYQSHPVRAILEAAGTGFLNGFNPCALSMVLLFFSLMAALGSRFLRNGLLFLFGKFSAYILLGILIANAFTLVPLELFGYLKRVLNAVLLVLCLALAVGNFLDAYNARKGEYGNIRVQLPAKLRKWNNGLIKKLAGLEGKKAFPVLIVAGSMVISLGEFLCTGQIYLASILRWVQIDSGYVPAVMFVVYAAALCLPSLLILLLVNRGKSVMSLTDISLQKMPLIKFLNGVLFLLLFLWAVFNF